MKTLVILVAAIACACAGPVGGGGYEYNKPENGYIFENPKTSFTNQNRLPKEQINVNFNSDESSVVKGSKFGINTEFGAEGDASGQRNPFDQNTIVASNLQPIVTKHYYLHVAPDEPQTRQVQTRYIQSAPEKHYKIIFVKVPSQALERRTEVILPPKVEEKTVVYVLVKKGQESVERVKIPEPEPTKPSQPEVFFVKYKTEKKIKGDIEGVSDVNVFSITGDTKTEEEVNLDLAETDGIGGSKTAGLDFEQGSDGDSSDSRSPVKAGLDFEQNEDGNSSDSVSPIQKPQSKYGSPN